jgi:hypothetical protein
MLRQLSCSPVCLFFPLINAKQKKEINRRREIQKQKECITEQKTSSNVDV